MTLRTIWMTLLPTGSTPASCQALREAQRGGAKSTTGWFSSSLMCVHPEPGSRMSCCCVTACCNLTMATKIVQRSMQGG